MIRLLRSLQNTASAEVRWFPLYEAYGVGAYSAFPVEVSVGGATVFVTNIERFEKFKPNAATFVLSRKKECIIDRHLLICRRLAA